MTHIDLMNAVVFLAMGIPALLAQADPSAGIWSELVKLGSIGIILGWITLIDIPARNKAANENVVAWREELKAERAASKEREAAFSAALEKFYSAIERLADSKDQQAGAISELIEELREGK